MERRTFLQAAVALPMAAAANSRAWGAEDGIRLIVRADDIGSSHAANVACIKCYRQGVARSVEVMVPCPWFNEAVEMLDANPAYDVGVHLTLTSEWTNLKWRPMTHCPSLVDDQGNFYAMVWPNPNIGPDCSIREANPKIEEVERELRAQIELAVRKIKSVTHLSAHMGFTSASPEMAAVVDKLSQEYRLAARIDGAEASVSSAPKHPTKRPPPSSSCSRRSNPASGCSSSTPGRTSQKCRRSATKAMKTSPRTARA